MTDEEKILLTVDGKGRAAKRAVLRKLAHAVIEQCAEIAECDYPASTVEERTYGKFIAALIREQIKRYA